jgi:hypothetical protein
MDSLLSFDFAPVSDELVNEAQGAPREAARFVLFVILRPLYSAPCGVVAPGLTALAYV